MIVVVGGILDGEIGLVVGRSLIRIVIILSFQGDRGIVDGMGLVRWMDGTG